MSMSVYYEAWRDEPLSASEREKIDAVLREHAVEDQIEAYLKSGDGPNWESFCVYDPADPTSPDVIFEGATKLPDNSEDACWVGLQHWANALTQIRLVLPEAAWDFRVEDHDIYWDERTQQYDPSV
ncbi:MAG: hypothetical protein AAGF10_07715 [Verrucomicrobiota bacterium]